MNRLFLHVHSQASDIWSQGLTQAKFLLKGLRDWDKGKSKHAKFMSEVCPHLLGFSKFLKEHAGIAAHSSFQLMTHRAAFYTASAEAHAQGLPPATHALGQAVEGGLPRLFEQEAAEAKAAGLATPSTTPAGWLRTPLLHTFAIVLGGADGEAGEAADQRVKALLGDVQSVARLVEASFADNAGVTEMLKHFEAILLCTAAPECAHGESVSEALLYFEDSSMQNFRAIIEGTSGGQGVFLAAACFVQESAKGAAGAAKVDLATDKLTDARLPTLLAAGAAGEGDDGAGLTVENCAVLLDGGIISVLDESTALVSEALALWTASQLDREGGKVLAWLKVLSEKIRLWDACMSAWLPAYALAPAVEYGLLGTEAEPEQGAEAQALEEISTRLDSDPVDEAPAQALIRSVVRLCEGLPVAFRLRAECIDCAGAMSSEVLPNSENRKKIVELVDLVCACPTAPESADAMVQEWTTPSPEATEVCFLRYSLELLRAAESLSDAKLVHGPFGDGVEPETALGFVFGPDNEEYSGSAAQAMDIPEWLRELAFVRELRTKVSACVESVLRQFAEAAHLPAARMPTHLAGGLAGRTAREALAPFFNPGAVQGAAEAATTAAGSEWLWRVDQLATVLQGLLEVIPPASFAASLSPLFAKGSTASACTDKTLVLGVCALFGAFSKVVGCAALVTKTFVLDGASCIVQHGLRPEAENCVNLLQKQVPATLASLTAGAYGDVAALSQWPFALTVGDVRAWLEGFEEALPVLSRYVVVALADDLGGLTAELSKATPRIEHVVSNTLYSPSLAAKHILGWPSRESMSQLCVAMSRCLSALARLQGAWGVQPSLEEDSATKDTMALARSVFDTAKEAMTVTAALSVLHEVQGRARAEKASSLLKTKKAVLPKTLWGPLEQAAKATLGSAGGLPTAPAGDGAGPQALTDA